MSVSADGPSVRGRAEFYKSNHSGLGREFLDEIDTTIQRILTNPQAWQVLEGSIRRCHFKQFPYGLPDLFKQPKHLWLSHHRLTDNTPIQDLIRQS
ncbi:hypothetical protein [Leptolyngbya sp. PCC 6406]|uniref:hypothetical protein n=1 Tax=Leptolyngbya sp. PCC 6406 TaxID=1173264 RepID=UPI0002AC23B7|nr:hypothetical protein [Leptolyngbya sp. PCC 6406]